MKQNMSEYNATGQVANCMEWLGTYGVWLWLGTFGLVCFTLTYFVRSYITN